MNFNERNEYMSRKLAHYNEWLLDPKREFGKPYPGFPEDQPKVKQAQKNAADVVVAAKAEAKAKTPPAKKAVKKRPARSDDGPTKQDLACKIYQRFAGDKASTIEAIQNELGMTQAGATTYFYNARKIE
jgi:hypothetical protein